MKAALGYAALTLGVSASFLGVLTIAFGLRRKDAWLLRLGRRSVYAVFACAILGVLAMEWALLTHDFSLRYVAENNARATPLLFTIAGLWAALEGSILLWALILGGYLAFAVHRFRDRATDPLVAWATLVGLCVALFFFALMLGPANPFHTQTAVVDGRGPNALLQNHWLMAIHPPMLYLGYVGFTLPFAFAVAALVTGRFGEGWLADIRRSTLIAWGFLTVGIILGGWWSYEVLGWGGYWAWDPVENASLLPWLTGTAFIHSVIVQERRGMLRVWNLSLVIATFCLTILGTFLTRSGVLNSVHSFTESPIGPWLLGFLAIVATVGIGLIAWRGDQLRVPGKIDSPISRESAFLGNNLLFAGLAFVVLLGTVYPLLAEALQGRQLSVGEPYFNRMTTPLGLALLFLMAVAPALPWRAASGDVLQRRLLIPAWVGGITMLAAIALGAHGITDTVTFGLAAFALAGIVRQFAVGARARRAAMGEAWPAAAVRAILGNPRLYGGLVVHTGIVLIAISLVASNTYATKGEVRINRGESASVAGYRVTYLRTDFERTGQNSSATARVRVHRGSDDLGIFKPAIKSFPGTATGIPTPAVKSGLVRDVYLTLISSPSQRDRVTIGVAINPMVVWLWIGGGVVALGTLLALTPSLRRRRPGGATDGAPSSGASPLGTRPLEEVSA